MDDEQYINIEDGLSVERSIEKIELSVGKIANKYEIFTEEEIYNINGKVPELDERVGNIEDDIEEINSSLEDITSELEVKADKSYVDSAIESVDVSSQLTNYATKSELSLKVDKVTGKSLISDSEIERLSTLKNYDDTEIKNSLNSKADKTDLHSHNNKSVLDGITSTKITEWNNKSTFDGNYNTLTNKPAIPTKTSDLTNDSGYLTSIPSEYVTDSELNSKGYLTEHQDISGKVDKINGYSLVNDAEISRLATLENYDDTEVRELIDETNTSLEQSVKFEVVGEGVTVQLYVDKEKEIKGYPITSPDRVIDENGVNIKDYVEEAINDAKLEGGNIGDSVFESLTLGIHTDGLIYLFKNGEPIGSGVAQSTTILPDGDVVGYVDSSNNIILNGNLSSGTYQLKYEMEDGSLIYVGQIVKEEGPNAPSVYTNLADPSSSDWITNKRLSTGGTIKDADGCTITNYITCKQNDVIRVQGLSMNQQLPTKTSTQLEEYDTNGNRVFYVFISDEILYNTNTHIVNVDNNGVVNYLVQNASTTKVRMCGHTPANVNDVIITVNEPI